VTSNPFYTRRYQHAFSSRTFAQTLLCSDHGDYSGDWHAVEKMPCALEDVLTRVPLMAAIPGGARGVRVPNPVETIDLFATLLQVH
jgi:arylsulfatase A-like enzyme